MVNTEPFPGVGWPEAQLNDQFWFGKTFNIISLSFSFAWQHDETSPCKVCLQRHKSGSTVWRGDPEADGRRGFPVVASNLRRTCIEGDVLGAFCGFAQITVN